VDVSELPTVPPSSRLPRPLGSGYLLLELIGSGAGGHVYRASRRADAATVAVKVLRAEHLGDPEMVTRFLREREALRAVSHPHLVRVLDLVAEGETLAIVMDFVPGPNLRQRLATGPPDQDQALQLLAQVAAALGAVHGAGIVHRDVKPENVLVVRRGGQPWARLTDFGIARILDSPTVTRVSQLVGTPAYVAPELVAGRPPGPEVDVYALGVTGYEVLTGERPFSASNTPALLRAHLETPPARPPGLPDPVWHLLRDCLAKDPADRPAAARLAAGFEALYGHAGALPGDAPPPVPPVPPPPLAPPPPPTPPPVSVALPLINEEEGEDDEQPTQTARRPVPEAPDRPASRRRRWPFVAALCALALLGAAVGLWAGHARGAGPARRDTTVRSGQFTLIWLPITVTSPQAGQIRLDFAPQISLPGFGLYMVFQDGHLKSTPGPKQAPPYPILDLDPGTPHCYRVAALVTVAQPTPAAPRPLCHAADGKPTPSTVGTG
jgi:serine/threonine protein kinase